MTECLPYTAECCGLNFAKRDAVWDLDHVVNV